MRQRFPTTRTSGVHQRFALIVVSPVNLRYDVEVMH